MEEDEARRRYEKATQEVEKWRRIATLMICLLVAFTVLVYLPVQALYLLHLVGIIP